MLLAPTSGTANGIKDVIGVECGAFLVLSICCAFVKLSIQAINPAHWYCFCSSSSSRYKIHERNHITGGCCMHRVCNMPHKRTRSHNNVATTCNIFAARSFFPLTLPFLLGNGLGQVRSRPQSAVSRVQQAAIFADSSSYMQESKAPLFAPRSQSSHAPRPQSARSAFRSSAFTGSCALQNRSRATHVLVDTLL